MKVNVATLNLYNRPYRWLQRRHLAVNEILEKQPDLVSLQELNMPAAQGRWLCRQVNMRLTGSARQPYRLVQKRKHHLIRGYLEGVGILSKLPILSCDWISLGYGGRVALRANVELPNGYLLDFVSVHLHSGAQDRQARLEQAARLLGWLSKRHPAPYQVVAGDFNETPDGPAIQQMKMSFRSAYAELYGREPLATYPTALSEPSDGWAGCLDYIFISKGVDRVVKAGLFAHKPAADDNALYPSDHVGLQAQLEIKDRRGGK